MPGQPGRAELIAGAAIGAITALAALFALIGAFDSRYVTAKEYDAQRKADVEVRQQINASLARIESKIDAHMGSGPRDRSTP